MAVTLPESLRSRSAESSVTFPESVVTLDRNTHKLKSKTQDGAHVHKVYFTPATPCDRLQAHGSVLPAMKEKLQAQFKGLDPVRLLNEIRLAQKTLSELLAHGVCTAQAPAGGNDVTAFMASLTTAWKDGEVRPMHRKQSSAKHW
jgi:hypothetical protein